MQNIDPLYFIVPITVIGFSFGLVIYWHFKRSLSKWVLIYSLVAYAGAIALKYMVQIPTIAIVNSVSGNNPTVLGVYYGVQTAMFEVGGAFLVATFAASRSHFKAKDAEGFGLGLTLWENGVLIGLFSLIDYITYYAILSTPDSSLAQTLYSTLTKAAPSLFYGPSGALPLIGYSILERVSSLLAHFSWGYLAVLSAVYRKRIYLAVALPIGFLIDFLVPFAQELGTGLLELAVLIVAVGGLAAALTVTRGVRKQMRAETLSASREVPQSATSQSLAYVNFKRSISYGKVYLILSIVLSVLVTASLASSIHRLSTTVGVSLIVGEIPTLILPIGAVLGSMGGLMIFTSDKAKGVYEYLIAYGVNTSRIFWSIVLASVGLVSIVLAISVPVIIGLLLVLGAPISYSFVELLIFYVIPISYTSAMFMSMAGMIWSFLATRRAGLNSPVGAAPILGILPMFVVLLLSSRAGSGNFIPLVGSVSLAIFVIVAVMIGVSNKKMVRERFLSNA